MDTTDARFPLRSGFGVEKWYADVFLEDGSLLIVTVGRLVLLGISLDRLSVDLHRPDGSRLSLAGPLGRARRDGASLTYPRASLTPERLDWTLESLAGSLRFVTRFGPFTPADPVLSRGGRRLRWFVSVPDGDVEGMLRTPQGSVPVRGRGYRDFVALDLPPWAWRGARLRWGRAIRPGQASVWFRLASALGTLEATWANGVMRPVFHPPALAREERLTDSLLTDLPIMRVGSVRRLLAHLGGRPRQVRTTASLVDGLPGRAIHELVTWESG